MRNWLPMTCFMLAICSTVVANDERLRDFHVLGIGINEYAGGEKLRLSQSRVGVSQLAQYFAKQDFDSDLPRREPRLLFDEQATKSEIECQLDSLSDWVSDRGTLVILYSGHGTRFGGQWYMVSHDADVNRIPETCVSGDTIMKSIDTLISRRHCRVLIVLSACYSGQILKSAEPLLDKYCEPDQGGLIVMAACVPSQVGWETGIGNIFNTTLRHGLEMMQAHISPTGHVSVKEIRRYLRRELQKELNFAAWKPPGVESIEQHSMVECSLSIPEDFGLTWADPSFVVPLNGSPALPAASTSTRTKNDEVFSPVGKWICVRPRVAKFTGNTMEPETYYRDEKGEVLHDDVELDLDARGCYRIKYLDFRGKEQIGYGRYTCEPSVGFSLQYDTGTDEFVIEKCDRDTFVLRNPNPGPSPDLLAAIGLSSSQRAPVWTFKRFQQINK